MFTRQLIEEIKNKLYLLGKKDSLFDLVKDVGNDAYFSIVVDGENKRITVQKFIDIVSDVIGESKIGLSQEFGDSMLEGVSLKTLTEALNAIYVVDEDSIVASSVYRTVILPPNMDEHNSCKLTQDMLLTPNTKYVIKYNYDVLENITMPVNCILSVDGGKLFSSSGMKTITGVRNTFPDNGDYTLFETILPDEVCVDLDSITLTNFSYASESGPVDPSKIPSQSIDTTKLADGSVTEPKLANSAVTENKIADGAVTNNKIAENAVTANKIAANAIIPGKIDVSSLNTEDLNLNNESEVEFADRAYNATTPNGMGYKILRQGEELTFANQVTETNTIYEIRYNFDLGNQTVNVPENATLYFNGGKVSNGTLNGNNGVISSIIPLDKVMYNTTLTGSWEYNLAEQTQSDWAQTDTTAPDYIKNKPESINEILPKWKDIFDDNKLVQIVDEELISGETFDDNGYWEIHDGNPDAVGVSIADNTCTINAGFTEVKTVNGYPQGEQPCYVYKDVALEPGIYIAACYASIDGIDVINFQHKQSGTPGNASCHTRRVFVQANGIGLSIQDADLNERQYFRTVDIPYVAVCREMENVPILKLFEVKSSVTVRIKFGSIYSHQGPTRGRLFHAGLYSYNGDRNPTYKEMYTNYKAYVENKLRIASKTFGVVYPDSECKQAFLDAMNKTADEIGLTNSVFFTPSGARSNVECPDYYINYVVSSGYIDNYFYTYKGASVYNTAVRTYYFDNINPNTLYQASNFTLDIISTIRYPMITYWTKGTYWEEDKSTARYLGCHRGIGSSWAENGKINRTEDVLIKPTSQCTRIAITTMKNAVPPVLKYMSDIEITDARDRSRQSEHIQGDEQLDVFRPIDTRMTAKDLCINGAACFSNENILRIYEDLNHYIDVQGEHPKTLQANFGEYGSAAWKASWLGYKGGQSPNIESWSFCYLVYDRINDKRMVIAYLKAIPWGSTSSERSKIHEQRLYDLLQLVRTNGEFGSVSALGAAGGYINDYNIYKNDAKSSPQAGNYILDFGNYTLMWHPSSTAKIMTTLVAVENAELADDIIFTETDRVEGTGISSETGFDYIWEEGDKMSLIDAIRVLLPFSDNTLATTIARCVGEKILIKKDNR